jgi:hypothetical protein
MEPHLRQAATTQEAPNQQTANQGSGDRHHRDQRRDRRRANARQARRDIAADRRAAARGRDGETPAATVRRERAVFGCSNTNPSFVGCNVRCTRSKVNTPSKSLHATRGSRRAASRTPRGSPPAPPATTQRQRPGDAEATPDPPRNVAAAVGEAAAPQRPGLHPAAASAPPG